MKKRRDQIGRGLPRKSRAFTRAAVERFEDRLLLTIYTVMNNMDIPSDTATSNDGTLRWAILASNANPATAGGFNVIDF